MNKDKIIELKTLWEKFKKEGFPETPVTVKPAEHKGFGVFAKRDIKSGEWVELCHSVRLGWKRRYVGDPGILQYAYWDNNCECEDCKNHGAIGLIPLGAGSIYNSAENETEANIVHTAIGSQRLVAFLAIKDVIAGTELLTWWGDNYFNRWCLPNKQQSVDKE
jgi:hypothetical protein